MTLYITRSDDNRLTIRREDRPFTRASIYAGYAPDVMDRTQPIAQLEGTQEVTLTGLDPNRRLYFEIVEEGQPPLIIAERRVPLTGAVNFRDLGGYPTAGGRTTRWGRVYRADQLGRLTPEDLAYLNQLGIGLLCDLRGHGEADESPTLLTEAKRVHLAIMDDLVDPFRIRDQLMRGDTSGLDEALMVGSYQRMLDQFPDQFGAVLRHIADPANLPLVFHCTAGKDRTGITAMLLLAVLGVPEDIIMADFELTNIYTQARVALIRERLESGGINFDTLLPIFSASTAALQGAIAHLDTQYGGVLPYLRDAARLEDSVIAALRENLLV